MGKKHSSIDIKLTFAFGFIVFVVMLTVLVTAGWYFQRLINAEEDHLSATMTSILSESISRTSFSGKYHARLFIEEISAREPRIIYCMLVDKSFRIMAHNNPLLNDTVDDSDTMRNAARIFQDAEKVVQDIKVGGQWVKEVALPYRSGFDRELTGVVRVGVSTQEKMEKVKQGWLSLGALIFFLFLLSTRIIYQVSRYFGAPVNRERALLRALLDSIPDLIFYKDPRSVYLGCNKAFEEYAGRAEQEIVGQTDLVFFPRELAEFFRKKDQEMLALGAPRRNEEWVTYPDGKRVLLDTLKTPFVGPDGNILGLVGVSRDITRMKEIEQALDTERERLLVTLTSIGDGVIATDKEGRVVLVNQVAEQLTGWSRDEAVGQCIEDILPLVKKSSGRPCGNIFSRFIDKGEGVDPADEIELLARDGTQRIIADSGAPIRDAENRIIGAVIVFRDVTEQKKMEQEVLKGKKLESVGLLAGGIAHDFNNYLAAILGNINLATMSLEPDHKIRPLLEAAEKALGRARELTQQLLTFSKGGDPIKRVTSLGALLRDTANFVLHGSGIACVFHVPDNLSLVHVDPGQISQVVQNLLINARQAMPDGGIVTITADNVEVDTSDSFPLPPGDYVKITVEDHGIGISQTVIDKIFDPYFSTKKEGSGLGLAISHSIIAKHGGHISVRSQPGVGSTFTMYLPASSAAPPERRESGLADLSGTGTVLVMDDEAMIRDVATKMLRHLGYQVVSAEDGEKAVEIYASAKENGRIIDVVLMDLTIPGGMGGKEAVQEILKINPAAKVIVSSGYSNDPVMAHYSDYGFCASVAKPFDLAQLAEVVRSVMSQSDGAAAAISS